MSTQGSQMDNLVRTYMIYRNVGAPFHAIRKAYL